MIESALLYIGATILASCLVALTIVWRRSRRWRKFAMLGAAIGATLAGYAWSAPAPVVSSASSHQRIDSLMPRYQFHERHSVRVEASPLSADSAIRSVTADEIRFYNALTWIRRFGQSGPPSLLDPPPRMPMLSLAARTGFQVIADEPGREIVLGVLLPISPAARNEIATARRLRRRLPFALNKPGYASALMNFTITPDERGGSIVSTETRVSAPDERTARSFARYWRVIYPGSALIRREWLAAIRARASR